MKNLVESFVVVYLKGGKHFRINNETSISESLLDKYEGAVKAELYSVEGNSKNLLDTVSK
jgi:hypothetical protein